MGVEGCSSTPFCSHLFTNKGRAERLGQRSKLVDSGFWSLKVQACNYGLVHTHAAVCSLSCVFAVGFSHINCFFLGGGTSVYLFPRKEREGQPGAVENVLSHSFRHFESNSPLIHERLLCTASLATEWSPPLKLSKSQ